MIARVTRQTEIILLIVLLDTLEKDLFLLSDHVMLFELRDAQTSIAPQQKA